MVRLKDTQNILIVAFLINFNTSMVRLKVFKMLHSLTLLILFQYLNGAIKSFHFASKAFNFLHFNTSTVRLKETTFQLEEGSSSTFQYLNGAIKSKILRS